METIIDAQALRDFSIRLVAAARRVGEREQALFDLMLALAGSVEPEPEAVTIPDILGPEADPVADWLTAALACGVYGAADTSESTSGLRAVRSTGQAHGPALAIMGADDERARRGPVLALVDDAGNSESDGPVRAIFRPREDATRGPVLEVMGSHPDDPIVPTRQPPRPSPVRACIGPKPEDPLAPRGVPYDPDDAPRANLLAGWGFYLPGQRERRPINGDALASFGHTLSSIARSSPLARACALLLTLRANRGALSGPLVQGLLSDGATDPLPVAVLGDADAAPRVVRIVGRSDEQWQRVLLRRLA